MTRVNSYPDEDDDSDDVGRAELFPKRKLVCALPVVRHYDSGFQRNCGDAFRETH